MLKSEILKHYVYVCIKKKCTLQTTQFFAPLKSENENMVLEIRIYLKKIKNHRRNRVHNFYIMYKTFFYFST